MMHEQITTNAGSLIPNAFWIILIAMEFAAALLLFIFISKGYFESRISDYPEVDFSAPSSH